MRKFKTCSRRGLPFRWLVIVAGALMLLAAFAPYAKADCPACIRFYDFEGLVVGTVPNTGSHAPALEQGETLPQRAVFQNDDGSPYSPSNLSAENAPTVGNTNKPAGSIPNVVSLGVHSSGQAHLNIVMVFPSATGIYNITSVSFASAGSGNGFQNVQLQMSTNGTVWTNLSAVTAIPTAITTIVLNNTLNVGGTLGQPILFIRLHFINGQSNGNDLQNVIDNIQVNGTIVPEPATVAGGLLGVLGLCWHQRRRLKLLLPRRT